MFSLAWTITRAGGWARPALLAGCTAAVSGLLLVAVSLLMLGGLVEEELASFVADGGTRGGVVFAVVLLGLPPLLLLDQAVRLGSSHRDRRLAALRVAGATPSETRLLGAIEVGIPAAVGAVLGIGVFAALRAVLGGGQYASVSATNEIYGSFGGSDFAVVPTSVTPEPWHVAAVVIGVALLGTFVGWRASPATITSPLGVSRRQARARPRPWGALLLLVAALLTPLAFTQEESAAIVPFVVIVLLVAAPIALAPWLAQVLAHRLARRSQDAESLLAAQRIIADPRTAGRAAAAIGGIALGAGGVVSIGAIFVSAEEIGADGSATAAVVLVAASLLVGLVIAAGSMAVHSVESLLDRRREVAFLAATGMRESELELAARREITLIALPLAVGGAALGAGPYTLLGTASLVLTLVVTVLAVAITTSLVWLAAVLAVRAVRPWARRAASPLNLRTE